MKKNMKVDDKYVKEVIDSYNKSISQIKENENNYPTIEMKGAIFYNLDMTIEEFMKSKNATDMNDFMGTNPNI